MLKMFTTQLSGLLSRLHTKEELAIEDGARLLAQAAVGDGSVYVYGRGEMECVTAEALYGEEPMRDVRRLEDAGALTVADRVLLVTRRADDEEAVAVARELVERGVPFVVIAASVRDAGNSLASMADVYLNTTVAKGMLPADDGSRFGFPSGVAALYLYHGLKFTLDEMIAEYEDEDLE